MKKLLQPGLIGEGVRLVWLATGALGISLVFLEISGGAEREEFAMAQTWCFGATVRFDGTSEAAHGERFPVWSALAVGVSPVSSDDTGRRSVQTAQRLPYGGLLDGNGHTDY